MREVVFRRVQFQFVVIVVALLPLSVVVRRRGLVVGVDDDEIGALPVNFVVTTMMI